jgi:hypothetical protein
VDHTFEDELNRPFERYQVLHDTIENVTSNLLGLTVACARCHDHKFDPVSQVEYYQLLAVLKPTCNPERWVKPQNRHLDDVSPREREAIDRHNGEIDRKFAELNREIAELKRPHEKKLFDAKLAALPEAIGPTPQRPWRRPRRNAAVQQYLANKLGRRSRSAQEVTRSLSEADRAASPR